MILAVGRSTCDAVLATDTKSSGRGLTIRGLQVDFPGPDEGLRILDGVDLDIAPGEALGLVGESGSGKTMLALSVLGLVPAPGLVRAESIHLGEIRLDMLDDLAYQRIRGQRIGMVFQNPMSGFSPVRTVGRQISDAIIRHNPDASDVARSRVLEALAAVGLPEPAARYDAYPHQMSGGMLQRAMIALALINDPDLLIADEPTTALDTTVQAQILELLRAHKRKASLLLVTHDLAVATRTCDRIAVIYGGRIAEFGDAQKIVDSPRHPYTRALLDCVPTLARADRMPRPIPGAAPQPTEYPAGCRFTPRCQLADEQCDLPPSLSDVDGRMVACWHPHAGVDDE